MLQRETLQAIASIPHGTIAEQSMTLGIELKEPLFYALDGMLRYAKAYQRIGDKLSNDYVLGPAFLSVVKGLRGLLDGDGAVAMERGITTDSKDNGTCESIFWSAIKASGYTERDI